MFKSNIKFSLCRTCLVTIPQDTAINIYNTSDLAKRLVLCSGQSVEITDDYPENICTKCYKTVLLFYEFQELCCKSLVIFREMLTNETLSEENVQDANKSPSNEVWKLLKNQTIESSSNADTSKKYSEMRKIITPLKKKLKTEFQERKTVIKSSSKSEICNINATSILKANDDNVDRTEHSNVDGENENILQLESTSLNNDSLHEEICTKLEIEEVSQADTNKSITDAEDCPATHEKIPAQVQNHESNRFSENFNTWHKLVNGNPSSYICGIEECKRSFDNFSAYKKHEKEHSFTQLESLKCDVANCDRVYKSKSALNVHKRKFHHFGPEIKKHMCEVCGKVFKSSSVLNDHQYTHSDKSQWPFACEEAGCAKRFSNKEKLRIHKMRHAGIKNFICPYCGMRKTTRNELKIHINYHTRERIWPCNFCAKVCNSAGNLKMHVKNIHERAKDFACRYCDRTFAKADTKKYHELTHTGEKPHECEQCGRRFLQPAALRTHRKIHLKQKGNFGEKKKASARTLMQNNVQQAEEVVVRWVEEQGPHS